MFGTLQPSAGVDNTAGRGGALEPDAVLFEFLNSAEINSLAFANYHLLYGSVTVICTLESTETKALPSPTASNVAAASSFIGTVLSVALSNGSNTLPDECVEMWVHCPPSSHSITAQLRRIRCCHDTLRALCSISSEERVTSVAGLPVQAGQGVFFSGGIDVVSTTTLTLLQKAAHTSHLLSPGGALGSLVSTLGGDTEVLNCLVRTSYQCGGVAQIDLFEEDVQSSKDRLSGVLGLSKHESDGAPTLVPLCCLPALACSPSLLLPETIARAVSLAMPTLGGGSVLVQATIQPMHPSVRLLPLEVPESMKRPRCDTGDMQTQSGYQLV